MSLETSRFKLHSSLKDLRARWEEIQKGWHDPVSKAFEERYWRPLEEVVIAAVNAMDTLSPVLVQAREECA